MRIYRSLTPGVTVLLLPMLTLLSAAVLIVASLLAWGAAEPQYYDAWVSTASGLIFVTPVLVVCLLGLRWVLNQTQFEFRVYTSRFVIGSVGWVGMTFLTLAYAATVGRSDRYPLHYDQDGILRASYPPEVFIPVTILVAVVTAGMAAFLIWSFYLDSIRRVSATVEGVDPMGILMQDQPR